MTVEDLENQKIEDVLINVSENKNEANETLEKLIKIKKETKIKIVSAHYKVK
jgi:archaellum component FlaF (FlaF/FlaG flagellin family)